VMIDLVLMLMFTSIYWGPPVIVLAWLVLGGRIWAHRIRTTTYDSMEALSADLIRRLGLVSPVVARARRLDRLGIEGRHPRTRRRVSVSCFGVPSANLQTNYVRFRLDVDPSIRVSFRPGALGGLERGTDDVARV